MWKFPKWKSNADATAGKRQPATGNRTKEIASCPRSGCLRSMSLSLSFSLLLFVECIRKIVLKGRLVGLQMMHGPARGMTAAEAAAAAANKIVKCHKSLLLLSVCASRHCASPVLSPCQWCSSPQKKLEGKPAPKSWPASPSPPLPLPPLSA